MSEKARSKARPRTVSAPGLKPTRSIVFARASVAQEAGRAASASESNGTAVTLKPQVRSSPSVSERHQWPWPASTMDASDGATGGPHWVSVSRVDASTPDCSRYRTCGGILL